MSNCALNSYGQEVSRKSGSARNELPTERLRGVLDIGFSLCAAPASYRMSRYFRKSVESTEGTRKGSRRVSVSMGTRMKGMVEV